MESDHHYESNPESEVRFEIESNLKALQVPSGNLMYMQKLIMIYLKSNTHHQNNEKSENVETRNLWEVTLG